MLKQGAHAPQRRDMILRVRTEQAKFDAALADGTDFGLIASLGKSLQTLKAESAQLPLSEEDYLTLADRHAALLQRMVAACLQLTAAQEFATLATLSAHLKTIKAMDTRELPRSAAAGKYGYLQCRNGKFVMIFLLAVY
jgi:hypothetical protein